MTMQCVHYDPPFQYDLIDSLPYYIMFQNKSLFRMLLIKKNVQWTFFMKPENRKRVYVRGTLIHEPEIDSSTLNRSNWSSSARFLGSF